MLYISVQIVLSQIACFITHSVPTQFLSYFANVMCFMLFPGSVAKTGSWTQYPSINSEQVVFLNLGLGY